MSAYIVSRQHIQYLVMAAMSNRIARGYLTWWDKNNNHHEIRCGDFERAVKIGQMLWDENIKSVLCRYPDDTKETAPGPSGENYVFDIRMTDHWMEFDPTQVIKSCDCYAYQSCEHEEWPTSEAHAFIDSLKSHACSALTGYDQAEWGPPKTQAEKEKEYRQKHSKASVFFRSMEVNT